MTATLVLRVLVERILLPSVVRGEGRFVDRAQLLNLLLNHPQTLLKFTVRRLLSFGQLLTHLAKHLRYLSLHFAAFSRQNFQQSDFRLFALETLHHLCLLGEHLQQLLVVVPCALLDLLVADNLMRLVLAENGALRTEPHLVRETHELYRLAVGQTHLRL